MSGGGSNETTQTTKVEYSPEEQAARNKIMSAALGTYDQSVNKGANPYTGARPVGAGDTTMAAQQAMLQNAQTQGQQIAQTTSANNFLMNDAKNVNSNPYLQQAMSAATQPMIQDFNSAGGALSGIREGAQAAGGFGGSRQGIAEGIAARGLERSVGNVRGQMASAAYDQGLQSSQAAVKNQGMLSMLSQMPGQVMGKVGSMQDAQAQAGENYNSAKATYENQQQWVPLQNLANIIYGGSNGTTRATGTAPQQDNTMATIGSLGQLAMMFI